MMKTITGIILLVCVVGCGAIGNDVGEVGKNSSDGSSGGFTASNKCINPLVGKWYGEEYKDILIFNSDGFVSYINETNGINCTAEGTYTCPNNNVDTTIIDFFNASGGNCLPTTGKYICNFIITSKQLKSDCGGGYIPYFKM